MELCPHNDVDDPAHLAVRGMPTGREAATSSFFPEAPLLLQGMWIPSSASESFWGRVNGERFTFQHYTVVFTRQSFPDLRFH